jgi:hypothetical protein
VNIDKFTLELYNHYIKKEKDIYSFYISNIRNIKIEDRIKVFELLFDLRKGSALIVFLIENNRSYFSDIPKDILEKAIEINDIDVVSTILSNNNHMAELSAFIVDSKSYRKLINNNLYLLKNEFKDKLLKLEGYTNYIKILPNIRASDYEVLLKYKEYISNYKSFMNQNSIDYSIISYSGVL